MQSGDNYFRMKEGIQIGWPPVVKLLLKKRGGSLWYSFTGCTTAIISKSKRQFVDCEWYAYYDLIGHKND